MPLSFIGYVLKLHLFLLINHDMLKILIRWQCVSLQQGVICKLSAVSRSGLQYEYGTLGIIFHPFVGALGPEFILMGDNDQRG